MIQVKTIYSNSRIGIEKDTNDFLKQNPKYKLIDIKFNTKENDFYVLIIYEIQELKV